VQLGSGSDFKKCIKKINSQSIPEQESVTDLGKKMHTDYKPIPFPFKKGDLIIIDVEGWGRNAPFGPKVHKEIIEYKGIIRAKQGKIKLKKRQGDFHGWRAIAASEDENYYFEITGKICLEEDLPMVWMPKFKYELLSKKDLVLYTQWPRKTNRFYELLDII
jgi:hypothetical protein